MLIPEVGNGKNKDPVQPTTILRHVSSGRLALRAVLAVCTSTPLVAAQLPSVDGLDPAPSRGPNLVLVVTDDQRWDSLSCTGNPWIQTPGIDRIGREGAIFRNATVVCSLCMPGRASLLTGRAPYHTGVGSNTVPGRWPAGERNVAEQLQDAGYATALIGKWHFVRKTGEPIPGFERTVTFLGQGSYFGTGLEVDGELTAPESDRHLSDTLVDHALEWSLAADRTRPFFLLLSFKSVHLPFEPRAKFANALADVELRLPDGAGGQENAEFKSTFANALEAHRAYLRTVLSVDEAVGRFLDGLDDGGLLDETVVLFTSDNGYQWGEGEAFLKGSVAEPSLRVPLLIRWPREIDAGSSFPAPTLDVDITPTLLTLAGVPVPEHLDGRDLSVWWRSADVAAIDWRAATLHHSPVRARGRIPEELSLRTDEWKYVIDHRGAERLFRYRGQPLDGEDVLWAPEHESIARELRDRLERLGSDTGLPAPWMRRFR